MKKLIFIAIFLVFLFSGLSVLAKEAEINFFFSPTCPHCAKEGKFLDKIEKEYPGLIINRYSVLEKDNVNMMKEFYNDYNVPASYRGMVPITFIEDKYFVGFDENTGNDIRDYISGRQTTAVDSEENNLPLPVLAIVLGALDGFNICSLGALVLILGLVLAIKSRKKTLLFGGIFIITTAVVYGFLIFIWYQIFSFFTPYMRLMHILIGLLSIGGAVYFFKQFFKFRKHGPACEITPRKGTISRFSSRFKESLKNSTNIILLLGSVFLFAAIITIIEFPCSAVIPVAFAGILAQSGLSSFSYLIYIIIFLIFYMLDEIIVFLIAFFTMKIWLSSSKVITWITLLEAIILLALGLYYLF